MRASSLAGVRWLLILAFGLLPLHAAHGATVTWQMHPDRELLTFRFDRILPPTPPKQIGLSQILIPVSWSFWQRERRPRPPDFSSSALIERVERTQEGVLITVRTDAFDFSTDIREKTKELAIEIRPYQPEKTPAPQAPEPETAENATALPSSITDAKPENASLANANASNMTLNQTIQTPPLSSSSWSLRAPIARPGQEHSGAISMPASATAMYSLRQPISQPSVTGAVGETAPSNADSRPASAPPAVAPEKNATPPAVVKTPPRPAVDVPDNASEALPLETPGTREAAPQNTANMTEGNSSVEDNSTAELQSLFIKAQTALSMGDMAGGRAAVDAMLAHPKLPESVREELLYTLADIAMQEGKADLPANFVTILDAYALAKHFNPSSKNLPEALLGMGYLHLSVGNIAEAKGYFDLLRRRFPDDVRVSMIDYYWGEHFLGQHDYQRAADHFQYVVRNHPESKALQASYLGLLKAFSALKYFDKAVEMVDIVERFWPSYYLADPSFLMTAGYAAMMTDRLERAREYFWAYYNIFPDAPETDVALARVGDILVRTGKPEDAKEIYQKAATRYPNKEGGLIAQMRLAEEGVLDEPSVRDMRPIFGRPEFSPEEIYSRILENSNSSLAPVAELKLAMWYLWNKRHEQALEEIERFHQRFPGHELAEKATEVAAQSFENWVLADLEKQDFSGIAARWDRYKTLFLDHGMPAQTRLTVASALLQTNQAEEALELSRSFIDKGKKPNELSEQGLGVLLTALVDLQRWQEIIETGHAIRQWNIPPERQRQVDYATALAYENLDRHGQAKPLWKALSSNIGLPENQRAYALYYLSRGAMAAGDPEQTILFAQDALNLLLKDQTDTTKIKDCLDLLIRAEDQRGRPQEALAWTMQYGDYVSETDADWPAFSYRKALQLKKTGDMRGWRETLAVLIEKAPNTLYSRMAASELEGSRLEQEAQKFE